jgi:NitT/TauT family transport system substrate-binding protein
VFLALFSSGALLAEEDQVPSEVAVYSATGGTTVVLPLLGAVKAGWPHAKLIMNEWKNLDDLKGLTLAGKGDIWLGHVESLALAASRGAPVALIAVTAWKKFYFVSLKLELRPGEPPEWPKDLGELSEYLNKNGLELASAPKNNPAQGVLDSLKALGGPSFKVIGLPPQQVILELNTKRRSAAILPEPIVTAALLKNPDLKIIANLEEEYAKKTGGKPRLPHAGVAANRNFISKYPALTDELLLDMKKAASEMEKESPEEMVNLLPESTQNSLGRETLIDSFSRDHVHMETAWEAKGEIEAFVCLTAPSLCVSGKPVPELSGFIYEGPRQKE